MEVHLFSSDLEKFILSLEKPIIAKIIRTIDLLEQFENNLGMPHSKKVAKQLFELRIHGAQEVRIFYTFRKNSIILLCGFVKKTKRIPQKEIKIALQRLTSLA